MIYWKIYVDLISNHFQRYELHRPNVKSQNELSEFWRTREVESNRKYVKNGAGLLKLLEQ